MKKIHSTKKGKLISIKKLSGDYDITVRRLKQVCQKEEIPIVKAMVQTPGGPQVSDAVYEKDIADALADLQLPTVTKSDATYQEVAIALGIATTSVKSKVDAAGFTTTKKLGTYNRGFYQPVRCITKSQLAKLKKSFSKTLYAE